MPTTKTIHCVNAAWPGSTVVSGELRGAPLMPTEPIETMTPEKWAALEAAHEAATPVPWTDDNQWFVTEDDQQFVMQIRNALPAILAEHKRAEEVKEAAEQAKMLLGGGVASYETPAGVVIARAYEILHAALGVK